MSIDCTGCEHKSNAVENQYCSEFPTIPQIDRCEAHTGFVEKLKAQRIANVAKDNADEKGYIWLHQDRDASTEQINKPV